MDFADIPPLDKPNFAKLCDEVKDVSVGQKLMNHMIDCEVCRNKALKFNEECMKHMFDMENLA